MIRHGRGLNKIANPGKAPPLPGVEPPVRTLFRRLEALEREHEATTGHTGNARWMIPYADLLTLLLGFFVVLFAASKLPPEPPSSITAPSVNTLDAVTQADTATDAVLAERLRNTLGQADAGADAPGDIVIRPQERGLVISLKDSILFAPGRADLTRAARETLDRLMNRLADQLSAEPGGNARPIRVEGHTDNTPIATVQYPSNWELSTARATNIVRYLLAEKRFAPGRLSAAGYGEFKPVAENSSIEGKQKNRRVDIVILNSEAASQEPPSPTAPELNQGKG